MTQILHIPKIILVVSRTLSKRVFVNTKVTRKFLHHRASARKQKSLKILCFVICVEDYPISFPEPAILGKETKALG